MWIDVLIMLQGSYRELQLKLDFTSDELESESSSRVLQVEMGGDGGQFSQVLGWAVQPCLKLRECSSYRFQFRLTRASWGTGSVAVRTKG